MRIDLSDEVKIKIRDTRYFKLIHIRNMEGNIKALYLMAEKS